MPEPQTTQTAQTIQSPQNVQTAHTTQNTQSVQPPQEPLTVQALIRRFEDKLRRMDDAGGDRPAGNGPRYPLLTVYLGGDGETGNMGEHLLRLWPQYRGELRFLRAEPDDTSEDPASGIPAEGTASGESAPADSGTGIRCYAEDGTALDGDGLRSVVSGLFGPDTHFADYDALFLCVVLDTSRVTDAAGLGRLLDAARTLRQALGTEDVLELWILPLDEGHGREGAASASASASAVNIRRELACLVETATLPTVLLLSSRRSDGRQDWAACARIAADVAALADSPEGRDLLRCGILTAGYYREEKPYAAISQLCVCALLDQFPLDTALPEEEELRRRLDLTRENTFQFLDNTDRTAYLPRPFQLEYFPLPAPRRADWMNPQTPAGTFDERTFGAWSQWLDRAWECIAEAEPDPAQRGREYAALLRERFSMGELAALGERREAVERWFRAAKPPSGDLPLLAYGEGYWRYRASSDPAVVSALLDALERLCSQGRAFVDAWRTLEQSRTELYRIEDQDLSAFYGNLLRDYIDGCGDSLRREFRAIGSRAELDGFLDRAMDALLRDRRMGSLSSFGDELAARLKTAARSAEASREILRKLSGDALPVYFQAKFNLGSPVRSFLLTRTAGPLYEDLRAALSEDTCFYDTVGGAAEALTLYRVERGQLL